MTRTSRRHHPSRERPHGQTRRHPRASHAFRHRGAQGQHIAFLRIVLLGVFLAFQLPASGGHAQSNEEEDNAAARAAQRQEQALEAVEDVQEQPDHRLGLEEIVITATKRAESVQDVPISVAALSGKTLEEAGITEFDQLEQFVPNLKITPATDTRSTSIRIRGIGSTGTNAGIDPSVGVFIDGIYQGRAGMSVGDLLDIERVEVLRGPQGTLFGKNTAAGAISITTRRPNYDPESLFEIRLGSYERREARFSTNFPILEDRVAARIAGYLVGREGYDINRYNGSAVNDNDKYGVRAKIVWDIDDEWSLLVSGDFSHQDDTCCVADIITYAGTSQLGTNFDRLRREAYTTPTRPFSVNNPDRFFSTAQFAPETELPNADLFDHVVGANRTPRNVVEVGGISADLLGEYEEHTIRWLSAYRTYSSDSEFDGDFSSFDAVITWTSVKLHQVSSELIWTSPVWEKFEAQGGLYLYYSTMDTDDVLGVQPFFIQRNFTMTWGADAAGIPADGIRNTNNNTHEMLSAAAYGQGTYRLSDTFSLTGGLRLTYEKKWRDVYSWSTWDSPTAAPPVGGPVINMSQSRSVTNIQWQAALRYFPVEDVMVYGKVANGFKSGGFNQVRVNNLSSEFNDEHALAYELGAKSTFFDRRLTVNLAAFFMDYDEFQAQLFDGTSINVRNAGRLFSYGMESEIIAMPIDDLVFGLNLGFNIAEYERFPGAENTIANQVAIIGPQNVNDLTPLAFYCGKPQYDCTQDLSGEVLDGAPRWTASAFAEYSRTLPQLPVLWFSRADWSYTSEYYLAQDLDENLLQKPFHLVNLRSGFRSDEGLWEITAWVTNVNNAEWLLVGFDVPVVGGFAAINGPPREYGATLRINF